MTTSEKEETASAAERAAKGFRLLHNARRWAELTVRDDQEEYSWLLDAARASRRRGARFRLVDSGRLDPSALEWLVEAGADLYTSDDIRPDDADLIRVLNAGRSRRAVVAYFLHGSFGGKEKAGSAAQAGLRELVWSGVDLHVSGRLRHIEPRFLGEIAAARGNGGGELVYYHHGDPDPELEALAGARTWIHVSDESADLKKDAILLCDIGRAGKKAGAGLALHVEGESDSLIFADFLKAGVYLLPKQPAAHGLSLKPLPFRAVFLDTTIMP